MKNNIQAFTLIEALITVAVFSILVTIGLPSMNNIMINNELTSRNNNLVAALQYARSESIKRGDRVVLCASTNSTTATPSCGTVDDWIRGWIVFHDINNDAVYTQGADTLLKQFPSLADTRLTLTAQVLKNTDPATITNYISFASPRGEPQQTNTTNQSGIFLFCHVEDPTKVRGVMVHVSGRIYSSREFATLGSHITCDPTI